MTAICETCFPPNTIRGADVAVGDHLFRGSQAFLVLGFTIDEFGQRFAVNCWGDKKLIHANINYRALGVSA